jgi:hypothetical protein
MTGWSDRVRRPTGPQELQHLRDAARDLADQTRHVPSRARVIFQTVADCAVIGTIVISGVLASIHLWKALFPKPHENHRDHTPEPVGNGRKPPHRHLKAAIADDPDHARSR